VLKRIALGFALLLAGLIVVLAANTLRQGSRQIEVAPVAPLAVDESAAAQRLAAAVRLRTLSFDGRDGASAGNSASCMPCWRNPFRGRMPCSSASS
jgi:carboxypeptidase PM20D1